MTVTGRNFAPGRTSVTIGGVVVPAADVTVTGSTSLSFVTPAHAAGTVDVTVTTPTGTSAAQAYTFESVSVGGIFAEQTTPVQTSAVQTPGSGAPHTGGPADVGGQSHPLNLLAALGLLAAAVALVRRYRRPSSPHDAHSD